MTYRSWTMAAVVALLALMGGVSQADVFNMPSGADELAVRHRGRSGQRGGHTVMTAAPATARFPTSTRWASTM